MSFRCRQKLYVPPSFAVLSMEQTTLENGDMVTTSVDQGKKVLPDSALFDLNDQLKAGINLEEVSSKVISKRNVSLPDKTIDAILNDKSSVKSTKKGAGSTDKE